MRSFALEFNGDFPRDEAQLLEDGIGLARNIYLLAAQTRG
jgi:hypothetical protein